jgi:hypothetical protein
MRKSNDSQPRIENITDDTAGSKQRSARVETLNNIGFIEDSHGLDEIAQAWLVRFRSTKLAIEAHWNQVTHRIIRHGFSISQD